MTPTEITAADTHDLRRRVLRDGDPEAAVDWPGDHDDTSFHLGIRDDANRVVAVSTWRRGDDGTQLRGMATDPEFVGTGLGSLLLAAGLDRCRSRGDTLVWANARVTALGFYERAGCEVVGDVFLTADTGLPHRVVRFPL